MSVERTAPRQVKMSLAEALQRAHRCLDTGLNRDAEKIYRAILKANPNQHKGLLGLAWATQRQGQNGEALRLARLALGKTPALAGDLFDVALVFIALRQWTDAMSALDRVLAIEPRHLDALVRRGATLIDLGKKPEALKSYNEALSVDPNCVDALTGRAEVLRDMGNVAEAKALLDRVIAASPDNSRALHTMGAVLSDLGKGDEAIDMFDQALAITPDKAHLLVNRAIMLRRLKRPKEALATVERALAIDPNHHNGMNLRGNVLRDLDRSLEAVEVFNRLIASNPNDGTYFSNRSGALMDLGRFSEALTDVNRALELKPGLSGAEVNLAVMQLRTGDPIGWRTFEARWTMEQGPRHRALTKPLWNGEDSLQDKSILLVAEQGVGDTIQFIRYAPLVAERGAKVIVEVQQGIKSLNWMLPGVSQIVGKGDGWPVFDYRCPLMSLPAALKTDTFALSVPSPYVLPTEQHLAKWRERLPEGRLRVGLAWSGNPGYRGDPRRSTRLRKLAPLMSLPNVDFVTLQIDTNHDDILFLREHPQILHPAANWEETTAILAQLDVVLTVDTSIGHLAGAMGRPVWLMLSAVCDYRWLEIREDTPWYPHTRLFRQTTVDDWDSLALRIRDELALLSERRRTA